jgi:CheY-like chemotaxis protein
MPDGGKLTIETSAVYLDESFTAKQLGVPPGRYVAISVADTGVGMTEETLSHAFEPFFTTKGAGRGTGLGLATAYGIVRQSGGAIRISSEPGKGTVARIYLPMAQAKTAPAEEPPAAEAPTGVETILLVEDETRVRKLILDVLRSRGYNVLEATRGEDALRLARRHGGSIDMALVDVVMPEMSGPDLVKELEPLCPKLRVLYMSGYTDEAIMHHGIAESSVAFLQKPFLPDVLARRVREVLDGIVNHATE